MTKELSEDEKAYASMVIISKVDPSIVKAVACIYTAMKLEDFDLEQPDPSIRDEMNRFHEILQPGIESKSLTIYLDTLAVALTEVSKHITSRKDSQDAK